MCRLSKANAPQAGPQALEHLESLVASVSGGPAATTGILDMAKGAGAFGAGVTDVLALLLAIAMGIQNSTARTLAVPDLTTTVLTMTLTGIGADSPAGHRGHVTLTRRVLVVAVMLAGGALGTGRVPCP